MKTKAGIWIAVFSIVVIFFAACEQNRVYNVTLNGCYINFDLQGSDTVSLFNGDITFMYQVASHSRQVNFVQSAYAIYDPVHTYNIVNPPQSIKVFSAISVDTAWTAGSDISHLFYINDVTLSEPFAMDKIFTPYKSHNNEPHYRVYYHQDADVSAPGLRQFRFEVTLSDGELYETTTPTFYLQP